jgi:hypothetical protein
MVCPGGAAWASEGRDYSDSAGDTATPARSRLVFFHVFYGLDRTSMIK